MKYLDILLIIELSFLENYLNDLYFNKKIIIFIHYIYYI